MKPRNFNKLQDGDGNKMKSVEAVPEGSVRLNEDKPLTHYASEQSLAKDWMNKEEDEAWRDL